jgi:hypothetical protein
MTSGDYGQVMLAVREIAQGSLPSGATVAVISRGDEELLKLPGRRGWHFPQERDGSYTGYHPSDSTTAIAQLEELRQRGAEYLMIPSTSLWWLDFYTGFREHLEQNYSLIVDREDACLIYQLSESDGKGLSRAPRADAGREDWELASEIRDLLQSLLPPGTKVGVVSLGNAELAKLDDLDGVEFPSPYLAEGAPVATQLAAIRGVGAEFLVVPRTAFSWLDQQQELTELLRAHHRFVTRQEHVCEVWRLGSGDEAPPSPEQQPERQESAADGRKTGSRFGLFRKRR